MKVELEKTFPMPVAADVSWGFLQNIEGVAGCMPGAKITGRIDATHYKGTISVKVGPASMSFKGEIEVRELDAAQRMLHLIGKGSDTTGSSGAAMDLVARIEPGATEGTSNLVGRSEVTMSGKAAAFGGRMMGTVAEQILKQFAGNFATQVQTQEHSAAGTAAAAQGDGNTSITVESPRVASTSTADESAVIPGGMSSDTSWSANTADASAHAADNFAGGGTEATAARVVGAARDAQPMTGPVASASVASASVASASAPANELNALALFWAILRDWLRGLFRRKPA
jgi:uncharacterized protein